MDLYNDETFGGDEDDIQGDFDFTSANDKFVKDSLENSPIEGVNYFEAQQQKLYHQQQASSSDNNTNNNLKPVPHHNSNNKNDHLLSFPVGTGLGVVHSTSGVVHSASGIVHSTSGTAGVKKKTFMTLEEVEASMRLASAATPVASTSTHNNDNNNIISNQEIPVLSFDEAAGNPLASLVHQLPLLPGTVPVNNRPPKTFATLEEIEAEMLAKQNASAAKKKVPEATVPQEAPVKKVAPSSYAKAAWTNAVPASDTANKINNNKDGNSSSSEHAYFDRKVSTNAVKERELEKLPASFFINSGPNNNNEQEVDQCIENNDADLDPSVHELLEKSKDLSLNSSSKADPHRGLMTREDKDYITRIQLSQLATDNPYLDDYYYQSYAKKMRHNHQSAMETLYLPLPRLSEYGLRTSTKSNTAGADNNTNSNSNASGGKKSQKESNASGKDKNEKSKGNTPAYLALTGALGKISSHSVRNPRQLLQVDQVISNNSSGSINNPNAINSSSTQQGSETENNSDPTVATSSSNTNSKASQSSRLILRSVERIYEQLFKLEDSKELDPELSVVARKENEVEREASVIAIFKELKLLDSQGNVNPVQLGTSSASVTVSHFIRILNFSKGKKCIRRLFPFLSMEQKDIIFQNLIKNFEQVDVVSPLASHDSTELFIHCLLSPLVAFLNECNAGPLILDWLTHLLKRKKSFLSIVSSKVGLVMLCVLLSRADILKSQESLPLDLEGEEEEDEDEEDVYNPAPASTKKPRSPKSDFAIALTTLFNSLYETLVGSFLDIFPAPTESAFYVWQFLALLVGSISMEQRHSLVVEVRERVLATVASGNEGWINDLNIFLNSMGLDASQLTS